jgi:hypothetical protein
LKDVSVALSSAIGGSLLAAVTMSVGGVTFPSLTGYRILFAICAGASVLVVVAALLMPVKRAAMMAENSDRVV